MTKTVLALIGVAGLAASANAQSVRLDSRYVVQEVVGAGATRNVNTLVTGSGEGANVAKVVSPNGGRYRITLQYKFEDLTDGSDPLAGLGALTFSQVVSGSTTDRSIQASRLTTGAANITGSGAENATSQAAEGDYAGSFGLGASSARSGFHRWIRSGVQFDTSASNGGTYSGTLGSPSTDNLVFSNQVNPFANQVGIAGISAPGQPAGEWIGIYSFELVVAPTASSVSVSFFPPGVPGGPAGTTNFAYWRDSFGQPLSTDSANVRFGSFAVATINVPASGSAALLGLGGLLVSRRRRA